MVRVTGIKPIPTISEIAYATTTPHTNIFGCGSGYRTPPSKVMSLGGTLFYPHYVLVSGLGIEPSFSASKAGVLPNRRTGNIYDHLQDFISITPVSIPNI
jgi:hypothetical protein